MTIDYVSYDTTQPGGADDQESSESGKGIDRGGFIPSSVLA